MTLHLAPMRNSQGRVLRGMWLVTINGVTQQMAGSLDVVISAMQRMGRR